MTPVLSVVKGKNGALIAEAARLWIKPDDFVLDLTYGKGNFWTEVRPSRLYTNDLSPAVHADYPYDFRDLSALSDSLGAIWDVVVFDPPYIAPGGRETSTAGTFNAAYGLVEVPKTPSGAQGQINSGIWQTSRILKPGGTLMVKCSNYITSGRFWPGHRLTVDAAIFGGFEQVDEFIHHSGTGPQPTNNPDGTPRRQVHSRRAHSFLCVFQKGK